MSGVSKVEIHSVPRHCLRRLADFQREHDENVWGVRLQLGWWLCDTKPEHELRFLFIPSSVLNQFGDAAVYVWEG
jgi:hypothetical protein